MTDPLSPGFFTISPLNRSERRTEYTESEPQLLWSLGLYGCPCLFLFVVVLRRKVSSFCSLTHRIVLFFENLLLIRENRCTRSFSILEYERGDNFRFTSRIWSWKWTNIIPWNWGHYLMTISSGSVFDIENKDDCY